MQAVIHVGEESEPYVKLLVQKRVDLAMKIVETWQTEHGGICASMRRR